MLNFLVRKVIRRGNCHVVNVLVEVVRVGNIWGKLSCMNVWGGSPRENRSGGNYAEVGEGGCPVRNLGSTCEYVLSTAKVNIVKILRVQQPMQIPSAGLANNDTVIYTQYYEFSQGLVQYRSRHMSISSLQ